MKTKIIIFIVIIVRHTYVLFYYVRICTHTIAHAIISHDEEIVWNPYPSPVWPAGEDIRNPLAAQQRRRVQIAQRRTPDRISLPHPQFTQSHGLSIHLSIRWLCPANLWSPAFIRTPAAGVLRSRTTQKRSNNQTYISEDGVDIRYTMCIR